MTLIEQILNASSLSTLGLLTVLWLSTIAVDKVVRRVFDRAVFAPFRKWIVRKAKAIWTLTDPIEAKFEFSFSPRRDLSTSEAKNLLPELFDNIERASNDKVDIDDLGWKEPYTKAKTDAHFIDTRYPYTITVELVPDTDSLRQHPDEDPDSLLVDSIHFEIDFKFPFHALEDTLLNLGTFISFIETAQENTIRGTLSDGQFVIIPTESDLTLDDWIENEKFDVSLLLKSRDEKTRVEFKRDKAIIEPPYREIDSETVRYFKAMVSNYYL